VGWIMTKPLNHEVAINRANRMSGTTMALLEIVKIFLALAGVFFLIDDGSKAYEAYTSQYWPTTEGEVVLAMVTAYADAKDNRSYRGTIKYAYTVDQAETNDNDFINYRVSIEPLPKVGTRAMANTQLEPYPEGSFVEVYYNPNRPEKSLLVPYFSLTYLIMPAVGIICLGIAISMRKIGRNL
ncbi:MAG: DUF3592 domain-containing protein, partial [Chloroflexota bacterium]